MTVIAVIVVNWNGGAMLLRCLDAVMQQTRPPTRVLVFDNASTDGSLQRAQAAYPSIEFVISSENVGFARANNACVQLCVNCEWVLLLNPDAFPESDCLEKLAKAAEAASQVGCVAPLIMQDFAPELIDSAGDCYRVSGIALHRRRGCPRDSAQEDREVFSATAAAALYRRSVFIDCGGFDESYFAYYEDVDLGFRMQLQGWRTRLVPAAIVRHIGAGTTGGAGNRYARFYGQRNLIVTFAKDMPAVLFWCGLPLHIFAVLRGLARGILDGQGILMTKATLQALKALPSVMVARRLLQANRRISLAELRRIMAA